MASSELFLRGIGVIYFLAFFSLWRELLGLYGSKGIVPIHEFMERLKRVRYPFWKAPTIFWISSKDSFLQGVALGGMALSVFVILGSLTPYALFLLYIAYLSFCTVGEPFLDFQWDRLLLESGFYAFLLSLSLALEAPMTWVLYVLLFRLMFTSGLVKWMAFTDHWRTGRAMDYHYESQPLPNVCAYFLHQSPRWFSTFSVYVVFFFELLVPFLIFFGGEEHRLLAFFLLLLFQWLILLTGNFSFLNLLTIVLLFPLLSLPPDPINPAAWAIASLLILLNSLLILNLLLRSVWIQNIFIFLGTWGIMSSYGLFANMTRGRHEIVIEGSDDGDHWIPYEFFYKPQKMNVCPGQIAPLHPRLDWQLWFIPSLPWRQVGWFVNLLQRLLEGSKPVVALFKYNPFPHHPPRYIRALIYAYKFTDFATWRTTGDFWQRVFKGAYTPPIHLTENEPLDRF